MDRFEALFLGLLQGLTEFLPVSSSGHLVIAQRFLGVSQEGLAFEVAMHVATSFSVLVFCRKRVLTLTRGIFSGDTNAWRYAGKLVVATIPAVVAVLRVGDFLEAQFESARSADSRVALRRSSSDPDQGSRIGCRFCAGAVSRSFLSARASSWRTRSRDRPSDCPICSSVCSSSPPSP